MANGKSQKELWKNLKSSEKGLSSREAVLRLKTFGRNEIQEKDPVRWYHVLIRQFVNLMSGILFVAGIVSFFLDERIDAYAIFVIVILNAIIGFIQEYKAERALQALKKLTAKYALALRDGSAKKIPAEELVPGDIIILEEGMNIPADAQLIESWELYAIESSLTGESEPVQKTINHTMFLGTVISRGHGRAVVTGTGMQTEFGRIAHLVSMEKDTKTPLQKDLSSLSKILVVFVIIIIAFLFGLSAIKGGSMLQMFMLSVSLAVSIIPEGLPAIITLTLALGVQNLARKNAIVRRLSAAETLGSTDVICTDKTGTLTKNQMTVQKIYSLEREFSIEGVGYSPSPKFIVQTKELELLLKACALCNNATLLNNAGHYTISGDPTEGALLTLAEKGGIDFESLHKTLTKKGEIVFDSERKMMSTINGHFLFTKGAPDLVLEKCTHLSSTEKRKILTKNADFAKQGLRVLTLAYKELKPKEKPQEKDLIFLGLVAMNDPPRPEVKDAIALCQKAHIKVVMITGDHSLTARTIGEKIGLFKKGDLIITGEELESMTARELAKVIDSVSIFARVSPHHKVKILRAFQQKGHTVAMTGDGVNDAPALKSADIGIAMGITGTDTAKEASDMILTDDNFATIVETVESGRNIYRNIKKFIRFLLSANFDEVIVISAIFLLGGPLPFLPLQILWINLLTDSLPALALGVDNNDENIMDLRPRSSKKSLWKDLLGFSIITGLLSSLMSIFIYLKIADSYSVEHMRTVMFTSVVVLELLLVFSARFPDKHFFTHFFKNKFLLLGVFTSFGIQLLAIYFPPLKAVLKTVDLGLADWTLILSMSGGVIVLIELWKIFQKKSQTV